MIDRGALAGWLGAGTVEVLGAPGGGGWSNETVFVVADGRRLVVRLTPPGRSMFPTYDLSHQVRALGFAREHGLPVPAIVADDPDGSVLGRPAFVMEHLAGRVPADDDPPFTRAGFLFEATPAEQRRFHDAAIDLVARVHQVPPLPFPATGPQPADHLAASHALATWCEWTPPILYAAHDALAADPPPVATASGGLLWGDARPANMVVDERFEPVGLLDWELAGTGPGELDIAWFCEMNRMRAGGDITATLPGFPDDDGTWRRWEAATGRRAEHVGWYHLYSAWRVAIFLQLYLAALVHRGQLPAGHRAFARNQGTRRLAELLPGHWAADPNPR